MPKAARSQDRIDQTTLDILMRQLKRIVRASDEVVCGRANIFLLLADVNKSCAHKMVERIRARMKSRQETAGLEVAPVIPVLPEGRISRRLVS